METLTAYVRKHSWQLPPDYSSPVEEPEEPQLRPATDIQAILTVLGRRDEKARKQDEAADRRLDLAATDLRGAYLRGAHLERANLWGARLDGAYILIARPEGANLAGAHLERANLWGAVGLPQEQLDMASGDDRTALPDGLTRPAHWPAATPDAAAG
jgi:hypothetical protein